VKESFERATFLTERFTESPMSVSTNAPWFDASVQHPLFDDNGDSVGSNDLSDPDGDGKCFPPGQGLCTQELFIGVSSITGNDPGDVAVTHVTHDLFLGIAETSTSGLWAQVDNNSRLSAIWVEVKPPGYSLVDPGSTGQVELDLPKTLTIDYNGDLDRYEWYDLSGFDDPGTYQVFYFAKDTDTGNVSPLMESRVYKALDGNNPPDSFTLVSPDNGSEQTYSVFILSWNDTTDPDGDLLTYTLLLSKDDANFSDPVLKEGIKYNSCLVGPEEGITDLGTFYWKVLAIDEYGAIRESDVRYFTTNITNPIAGWIKGLVYNTETNAPINDAAVTIGSLSLSASLNGYFLGILSPGSYTLSASKSGYNPESLPVTITEGSVVSKNIGLVPIDNCPDDPNKTEPGVCGCGVPDTDTDQDTYPDCIDLWPEDPAEWADNDEDGVGDNADPDDDEDGMPDAWENAYGLDPLVDDADEDLDNDGYSNLEEYGLESDPTNRNDPDPKAMPWLPILLE
jgi:hypothetical protein